jgi:hypothetical protein
VYVKLLGLILVYVYRGVYTCPRAFKYGLCLSIYALNGGERRFLYVEVEKKCFVNSSINSCNFVFSSMCIALKRPKSVEMSFSALNGGDSISCTLKQRNNISSNFRLCASR